MLNILRMSAEDLLQIKPSDVVRVLTAEEILHIFAQLGGFWSYDREAAKQGHSGLHALLKSGRHSDGFVNSRVVLPNDNICRVMARQLVYHWRRQKLPKPDWVIGIPDGATRLGEHVGKMLGVKIAKMEKVDGKIQLVTEIGSGEKILLVEDFCTRATGFKEAVASIKASQPNVEFAPVELVIINRGGLEVVEVDDVGEFAIVAAATHRISDWEAGECPLCNDFGSEAIKPKVDEESWKRLVTSQIS